MTRPLNSTLYPFLIIIALIIFAVPTFAGTNLSVSKAREFDPIVPIDQLDYKNTDFSSPTSPIRSDVDGHLVIYVVEPTSRWLDNGQSFPPAAPKPFGNAVIAYPFDQEVYINESFDLTLDWDGTAAGFGDITEGNIKVMAAYFKTEGVATHFVVNGRPDLYFDAYHLIAAAEATSGNPGSSYSDGDYTHTVLIEESAATW